MAELRLEGVGPRGAHRPDLDVSLGLDGGAVGALLGPNGVGKSSLLEALAGHLPMDGRVWLDDQELSMATATERARAGLVLCPQGRRLFGGMSVRDNLLVGAHLRPEGAEDRLAQLRERLPLPDDAWSRPAGTLSGGEQQLVSVARAWMMEPRVLLLDEPDVGLSPAATEELAGWLRELAGGRVTLLVSSATPRLPALLGARTWLLVRGSVQPVEDVGALDGDRDFLQRFFGFEGTP